MGPLFDHFALTLAPGERTEMFGPLFHCERQESRTEWAVCPFCSAGRDPDTDAADFDLLYPLLTWDRFGGESRFQLLQLFSRAGGRDQEDHQTRRLTLFPLYFQQRSEDPDRNYTALVPFGGRLQNRLFRDEIQFILFPLYSRSRKRDVVTDNYLYPVVHVRRGEGLHGWQVWPFYGAEHKDVTTRTNGFGEVHTIGGHDKHFVLWPLFFTQTTDRGTEDPKRFQALLPFYARLRSPQRDSSTWLWPLFTYTEDRGRGYREWDLPWPFIVVARGAGKTTTRVWPLFGRAAGTNQQSEFYLWPLYLHRRLQAAPLERERTRGLFFLYSDAAERDSASGQTRRRLALWPLFTHRRDWEGSTRWQVLALLEPLLPNNRSVERNYSPLWSLWRAERHPGTGAASQSLLWNLYRREVRPGAKKCSLFFGLFQYESDAQGRRARLFYLPLSGRGQPPARSPAVESRGDGAGGPR